MVVSRTRMRSALQGCINDDQVIEQLADANSATQAAMTAQLTTVTFSEPGTPDYAIADLTQTSPFGFVAADEGQTVLKVIANLQVRLAEVESVLETAGIIATN